MFILIFTFIISEVFHKQKYLGLLIANGQNPMIAYVGFANLIWPVLALSGLEKIILELTVTPWLGFLRGVIYTVILAYIVRFLTNQRIFWRT